MKPQSVHAHEDRLLDFVYGELPPVEARAVESHLEGCSRCSELLAGIRGIRTSMAQLPMEPAPDAGLESLLAYAQQAARNAAAGPAPKPTWWRRMLMPVMGVAAVSIFGIVSIQVSKSVELSPELSSAKAESQAEAAAVASPAPSPVSAQAVAPEKAQNAPLAYMADESSEAPSPPPPPPSAKLDRAFLGAKEAPRKRTSGALAKDFRSGNWSNTGGRNGFAEDAEEELARREAPKKSKGKSADYGRRDEELLGAGVSESIPAQVASAEQAPASPSAPAPVAAEPMMEAQGAAEGGLATGVQVQQQSPDRGSLRVGGGSGRTQSAPPADKSAGADDDFDALFGEKKSEARRQPPPTASAAPMASAGIKPPVTASRPTSSAGAGPERSEAKGASSSQLSKLADAALRSGDRVREAQFLRQALAAGATGKERLALLGRLCDAEFAIGRRQAAIEACSLVLEEDPRSSAAQLARRKLRSEAAEADDANAKPGSKAATPAAPAEPPTAAPPPQDP